MSKGKKAVLLIILVLVADQALKFWVKTTFVIGEQLPLIGKWATLHFIENNGMAFGLEMGGKSGKVILTLIRIGAAAAIAWFMISLIKKNAPTGFVLSIAVIFAGAVGNILDSMFYGMIFSESFHQPAVLFPDGGGYSSFMQGRVVDMFYFPVINTTWPDWFPYRSGESFIFFRPVFNIADAAITTGVIAIILFQKRFFSHEETTAKTQD